MNLKRFFLRTPSAAKEQFCEEVGLFEDAVKAILEGSEPWQITDLKSAIAMGAFSVDEQRHLDEFVSRCITEKKKEIVRVAMTKVLTGNGLEKSLANKIATLGQAREEKVLAQQSKGLTGNIISQNEYELKKKLWQHEQQALNQFQNSARNYPNSAAQSNMYTGAGGVPLERIENPFSSK